MPIDFIVAAFWLWLAGAGLALVRRLVPLVRVLLGAGGISAIIAALTTLPGNTASLVLPMHLAGQGVTLHFSPAALWLMGFGLVPAVLACWLGSPRAEGRRAWLLGAGISLIGVLGVFGLQDGMAFLIAWELMSLGSATMILGEGLHLHAGRPTLFMLGLLEVGTMALVAALLLLDHASSGMSFAGFVAAAPNLSGGLQLSVGLLLVLGFGAKLGLLPFYEWFPGAYGSASGATGALLSGVILNAAFFGLSRGLLGWLPAAGTPWTSTLAVIIVALAVVSSILAALYAFQQEDWRTLLSLSTAENAAIAVAMLGVSLLFRQDGLGSLAGLAWTVAMLHLAGHALAKGGLFLTADGISRVNGSYAIAQSGLLRRSTWPFGLGALFAAMSLAAMPPQAGFVSEWYVFQTVFQGFHLSALLGRLVLALAGAGLALTAAIALATFIKVFGIGLLGDGHRSDNPCMPRTISAAVFVLGIAVFVLAVGMPVWLGALDWAVWAQFGAHSAQQMRSGWLLVPLTAKFAFISPSLLAISMPLLALVPLGLLIAARRRFVVRKAPVWYGGLRQDTRQVSTTALSFANALRTFYSFIYRPTADTAREHHQDNAYFVKRLAFTHEVAPIFGPYLFSPVIRGMWLLAGKLRKLQSGNLNFYIALIGGLLIIILAITLI